MSPANLRTFLELVRFSHTIFALPFAIIATLLAFHMGADEATPAAGWWTWSRPWIGILLCMASARTAAMAFNRLVDRSIDAANPRTASRHLPRGDLRVGEVLMLVVVSAGVFVGGTLLFLPNWLPLVLSGPVLAWLLGYSYAKRFTALAHLWLGVALGMAPLAAWIAIRGSVVMRDPADLFPAALLGLAVTVWVAGFDIIYACQDADFDAAHGLWSIPARLAVIAGLLIWEHSLVRADDLSRVNDAFFTANAIFGIVLLLAIAADIWV